MPVAAPFELRRAAMPAPAPEIPRAPVADGAPVPPVTSPTATDFATAVSQRWAIPSPVPAAAAAQKWPNWSDPSRAFLPTPETLHSRARFTAPLASPPALKWPPPGGELHAGPAGPQVPKRPRSSHPRRMLGKLAMPVIVFVIAGVAIGGYLTVTASQDSDEGAASTARPVAVVPPSLPPINQPVAANARADAPPAAVKAVEPPVAEPPLAGSAAAAAPTAAAEPPAAAPAASAPPSASAPPAVAPAASAPPATEPPAAAEPAASAPAADPTSLALVDVRIQSTPSGATVTLIDRGHAALLGVTPVSAAVDPSRDYDLVFSSEDHATRVEHLDPRTTRRVVVALDKSTAVRAADSAVRRDAGGSSAKHAERSSAAGDGTLMISSKPPCEITIDGTPTGLTTPQRSIALPAGRHKITLINDEKAIKKTFTVQIAAGATEKLIEDLMDR